MEIEGISQLSKGMALKGSSGGNLPRSDVVVYAVVLTMSNSGERYKQRDTVLEYSTVSFRVVYRKDEGLFVRAKYSSTCSSKAESTNSLA